MKDQAEHTVCQRFQDTVAEYLIRHQSILDIISKSQEASARTNRAVIKAVTNCGCLKITADKPELPSEATLSDLKIYLSSHLNGDLCPNCRDIIEAELGRSLFYLTALCHHLDFDLEEIIEKEQEKLKALGIFNFT